MSIFKNSKFKKSLAYLSGTMLVAPHILSESKNVKVFADGDAEKKFSIWEKFLESVLSFIFESKERVVKVIEYIRKLTREEDKEKDTSKQEGNNNEENELGQNLVKNVKEENEKDKQEGNLDLNGNQEIKIDKFKINKNKKAVDALVKGSISLDFKEVSKIIKDVNGPCNSHSEILEVYDFRRIWAHRFGFSCYVFGFGDIAYNLNHISESLVQNIDTVIKDLSFDMSQDKEENIECNYVASSKKTGKSFPFQLKFKVDEDGLVFVEVKASKNDDKVYLPISLYSLEMSKVNCVVEKRSALFWRFLDPFCTVVELFWNRGLSSDKYNEWLKNLETLLKVFEKSDKTGKLVKTAQRAIRIYKNTWCCVNDFLEAYKNDMKHMDNQKYSEKLLEWIFSRESSKSCKPNDFKELKNVVASYLEFIGFLDKKYIVEQDQSKASSVLNDIHSFDQ